MTHSAPEVVNEPLRSAEEELGEPRRGAKAGAVAVALGALGVVFGDIGTSPLYALQNVFAIDNRAVTPGQSNVYGVISLVFWSITMIVSVKYVTLILRADNHGEGGIMALIALVLSVRVRRRMGKLALVALGIFGASLFYGDGMITPAISVLSAVEGLEVASPSMHSAVVPITLLILTALFAVQRFGTSVVGRAFGPVMAVWFLILGISGLAHVVEHPGILRALVPVYAVEFFLDHGTAAFLALGAVVLTVTGAEALYADMGHFGRSAIRRAWFAVVFPALILNYMGQGALILGSPKAVENPFYLLFPHWLRIPMVVCATLATIIASQAVISGAFSVTRQAVQLGFLPRLRILHTGREVGQVYVPAVNWGLFVAVVGLVIGFGSSQHLANAYGIAVTGTLAIDTVLFFFVVRAIAKKPLWMSLGGAALFLVIDLSFFGANIPKVEHGGWFPLAVALIVFFVLTTWQKGREIVRTRRHDLEGPLEEFVEEVRKADHVLRPKRTAVFLNADRETTPLALRTNYDHNHAVHETVLIVSIQTLNVPHVREAKRLKFDDLGYDDDGISHLTAYFGFQDDIDLPATLRSATKLVEGKIDFDAVSYFVSRIVIVPTGDSGMNRWRKRLFVVIARNAANPATYLKLPDDCTVVMGAHIEI